MIEILALEQKKLEELCRRHFVQKLSAFGSVVRDDFDLERSDLDFRVLFDEALPIERYADNYFELKAALSELFRREIDLISARNIRNPYLLHELKTTQVALYAA
jgi:predicted nucleotidyltransferase